MEALVWWALPATAMAVAVAVTSRTGRAVRPRRRDTAASVAAYDRFRSALAPGDAPRPGR